MIFDNGLAICELLQNCSPEALDLPFFEILLVKSFENFSGKSF